MILCLSYNLNMELGPEVSRPKGKEKGIVKIINKA
ncbi:MAG: hypothetical protein UX89_C0003G0061 [Parcubacteria group bacterium GW2011_GWA2_47_16]|nr:MAG: hypothetical protein UX89_C0003G0061 [Parcubacteria group bacterium GW2011_GWA2_47_16]